jgi:tRNA A-37 threonylcarbamoyl transferase component Bud32/tetratricopeptide (TPR) repeat protein
MNPDEPEERLKPERWREVEALFLAAREREPSERATFLDQTCGQDSVLRQEVESLLAADQGATGFLEPPGALSPLVPDFETMLKAELAGRYAIEGELGRGGMATVYLAEDVRHHRRVAIKVLHPELGAVLGAERFLREIGIAARLSHPHILPLHDSGTLDLGVGRPVLFYAMPYVAGRSLRERLREELQLPIDEALGIARQVADALDHAHRQGVIHRDIKPENILLADGQAVLADFGIARALDVAAGDRLTETGLAVGTPAYMSPEQAAGTTRLDGRSDIYALGCVLYEILGGQPPFPGPTPQAILARHAVDPVPSLRTLRPTVPRGLGQVVTRALAKVPADRFPTARAFAEALTEAASAPVVLGDESTTAVTLARRGAGRRRRWIVAAAASAAITGAGLAAALARKPPPLEPRRVLVLPFQNRTSDSTLNALADVAADYVIRGLRATNMVEEVVDARSQGEEGAARRLNATGARAAARAAGAGNIVLGAYDRAPGDSLQLQAEVLDTRTGGAVRLIGPVGAPVGARLAALEGLRSRVMAAVGSLLEPDFSEASSLPATYEALVEWKAGIDGWDCCRERALEHFRRAAAIDSNFTLALTEVAFKSWQVGNCTRVDSIAAALRPRLERLPPVDGTQLGVAASLCHGNLAAAVDAATGGVDAAPADERLLSWKAMVLLLSNRPRETIDILERFDETRALEPGQDVALLLGAYHRVGTYDRALAYIAQIGRVKLNTSGDLRGLFLSEEAASRAALGRVGDVTKTMDEIVRQLGADQQGLSVIGLLEGAGQELAVHGHAAAAEQAFDRAIRWAQARPTDQQATPDSRRALASVLNSAGRWNEALALYRVLAAVDSSDTDVQAALGDLAARRGDRAEAERVDRWLAAQGRRGPAGAASEYWALYQRARIAGLLGQRERAMGLLREAEQKGFAGWRVAHLDPDLAPLRGDPAFQEWVRPKD